MMKKYALSAMLLSSGLMSAYAETLPSDTDCILNWAETQVPTLLQPHTGKTISLSSDISYRVYPATGVYVGVNNTTSTVLALGGTLGTNLITVGAVSDFLPTARSAGCAVKQGFISLAWNVAFQSTAWAKQNYIIQNETEFRNFWNTGKARYFNGDGIGVTYPLPKIDFSKYTLVGVVLDDMSNGCYSFGISRVQQINGIFEVESKISSPSSNMICTMALVPAFDFVLIEKTNLPINFINQ